MDLAAFVAQQQALLRLEQDAEAKEAERLLRQRSDAELAASGLVLLRMLVTDLEPGLGGRLHAVLRPSRGGQLPAHRFGPGDLVALREGRDGAVAATAVVARVRDDSMVVALDDDDDAELPDLLRVERLASDVTWRRIEQGLRDLQRERPVDERRRLEALFGEREPEFAAESLAAPISWLDPALDPSQREAVALALRARQLALIHGPPGTGKTTAVVELIRQAVQRGERVLACAPSNVAVDNLVERLAAAGLRLVRLGHPARMLDAARDHSLAAQVAGAEEQKLLRDIRREVQQGLRQLHKARSRAERQAAREQLRTLRAEQRQIETAVTRGIVDGAAVVLATTIGAADPLLAGKQFDRVVIDEAAQALEAACWIPLQRGRCVVLAGDHRQLPPTIRSPAAERQGLARTLFERLAESGGAHQFARMLTVQYRMHHDIMGWSAATFYEGRLTAAEAVRGHRLVDLPGVVSTDFTAAPLVFVDTAGTGHEETTGGEDRSKANPGEAALVEQLVRGLLAAGVPESAIAVLTPYNAQVQLLRQALADLPALEIGSVDALQGREKEAVVFSFVRSNERGEVGFLAEARRLNVAMTRARRHLCLVGDSATLAQDPTLATLIEYCQAHGSHRSAFEL